MADALSSGTARITSSRLSARARPPISAPSVKPMLSAARMNAHRPHPRPRGEHVDACTRRARTSLRCLTISSTMVIARNAAKPPMNGQTR